MNINKLVSQYVTYCRALGERCKTKEFILRAFCRAVGPQTRITRIRLKDARVFLAGKGTLTNGWHGRYFALKGFFQFAICRGDLAKNPLPTTIPNRVPTMTPYIYSRDEIRRLLDAIPAAQHGNNLMEPHTLRAILLVLYGAGLRRGESLRLTLADVDLPNSILTIRNTKFFKSRLVPISRDLTEALSDYAHWRATAHPSSDTHGPFFVNRRGEAVFRTTIETGFNRLRRYAGVRRSDGARCQPRMHDLRHSFAVHRLIKWYRQGADVQRLIYHLSVYLGHAHLADTQLYLTLTPELLQQAGQRFERYARREVDHA
ncbi:MAG: integrase [Planctomycetaceae bacterium]|nr:integrase [Planctomycetaceae bacterium]